MTGEKCGENILKRLCSMAGENIRKQNNISTRFYDFIHQKYFQKYFIYKPIFRYFFLIKEVFSWFVHIKIRSDSCVGHFVLLV